MMEHAARVGSLVSDQSLELHGSGAGLGLVRRLSLVRGVLAESQVRTGLPAGEKRIRTTGPSRTTSARMT
jgi:hypothetical protein